MEGHHRRVLVPAIPNSLRPKEEVKKYYVQSNKNCEILWTSIETFFLFIQNVNENVIKFNFSFKPKNGKRQR